MRVPAQKATEAQDKAILAYEQRRDLLLQKLAEADRPFLVQKLKTRLSSVEAYLSMLITRRKGS